MGAAAGLLLALGTGCPGDDTNADATSNGTDADGGSTAVSDPTSGESNTSGVSEPTSGSGTTATSEAESTDDGADSGSSDTGPVGCVSEPLDPANSAQTVTLTVVNDTEASVFYVGEPIDCTPFEVARDDVTLRLAEGYWCGCECPPPPNAVIEPVEVPPEGSFEVTWDARALALYPRREECFEDGSCYEGDGGALRPVEPGAIRITVPMYEDTMPLEGIRSGIEVQSACAAPMHFEVTFDLAEEDVAMTVLLSEVTIE